MRLANDAAQSGVDANKEQTELEGEKIRFVEAKLEAKLVTASLSETQSRSANTAEVAEDTLHQLTEVFSQAQLFFEISSSLEVYMSKVGNAPDDATGLTTEQSLQASMLKARIALFRDEPGSQKQKVSTSCDMEVVSRNVADVKGDMNNLAGDLGQDIFYLYAGIQHYVGQSWESLVAVSKCSKGRCDHETKMLQQTDHDALYNVAGSV